MKSHPFDIIYPLVFSLLVFFGIADAQDTLSGKQRGLRPWTTSIITSVPFNGMRYFIKIVPLGTTNIDNMPIVPRESDHLMIWKDSLRYLLPDSILKQLPRREGPFHLIPPGK